MSLSKVGERLVVVDFSSLALDFRFTSIRVRYCSRWQLPQISRSRRVTGFLALSERWAEVSGWQRAQFIPLACFPFPFNSWISVWHP